METLLSVVSIVVLALLIAWNVIQSKRVAALQKRVEALEKT